MLDSYPPLWAFFKGAFLTCSDLRKGPLFFLRKAALDRPASAPLGLLHIVLRRLVRLNALLKDIFPPDTTGAGFQKPCPPMIRCQYFFPPIEWDGTFFSYYRNYCFGRMKGHPFSENFRAAPFNEGVRARVGIQGKRRVFRRREEAWCPGTFPKQKRNWVQRDPHSGGEEPKIVFEKLRIEGRLTKERTLREEALAK